MKKIKYDKLPFPLFTETISISALINLGIRLYFDFTIIENCTF